MASPLAGAFLFLSPRAVYCEHCDYEPLASVMKIATMTDEGDLSIWRIIHCHPTLYLKKSPKIRLTSKLKIEIYFEILIDLRFCLLFKTLMAKMPIKPTPLPTCFPKGSRWVYALCTLQLCIQSFVQGSINT